MTPDQGIRPNLAESLRPQLLLPDRLVSSYKAQLDVALALEIYNGLDDPERKAYKGLDIVDAQIDLRLDPSIVLSEVKNIVPTFSHSWTQANLYRRIGHVQTKMGDLPTAIETLKQASLKDRDLVWGYIDVAKVAIIGGLSPDKAITKAIESVNTGETSLVGQALQYANIAEVQNLGGLNSKELLEKALTKFEQSQEHAGRSYTYLILRYAQCGYYNEALQLVDRIEDDFPEQTKKLQNRTMYEIAAEQIKAGLLDEAMTTAQKTDDVYIIASVAVEAAIYAAKRKIEGSKDRIAQALDYTKRYEDSIKGDYFVRNYQTRVAGMYSAIGEAQSSIGIDPMPSFETAIAKASVTPNIEEKAKTLAEIGRSEAISNVDAIPAFNLALETIDTDLDNYILTLEGQDVDVNTLFPIIHNMGIYQNIGEIALEVGYDDILEELFARFDKYFPILQIDNGDGKIELLTNRAKLRSQRGLRLNEINNLTQEQIQSVVSSGNQEAIKALEYFGLMKGV